MTLLKINDLGIGTENMFISPWLSFQDGRVWESIRGEFFCEGSCVLKGSL